MGCKRLCTKMLCAMNDVLGVAYSVSGCMCDCAASESTQEAMVDALAESREPMLESECVRNLLS